MAWIICIFVASSGATAGPPIAFGIADAAIGAGGATTTGSSGLKAVLTWANVNVLM